VHVGREDAHDDGLPRGEHPAFDLAEGDVVVLSSRVIPGNEPGVMHVMSDLLRRGVVLRSWWSDRSVHVSGHAHRDEQRRMIEMVRPRAFVPVHGTLHHLLRHAALARELGVPEVCVLENGDLGEVDDAGLRRGARAHAGRVHVFAQRPLAPTVLHERAALAAHGVVHVVVPVDGRGRPAGEITLVTRGVVDETLDEHVLAAARNEALAALEELAGEEPVGSDAEVAEAARQAVRRALGRVLGFKPVATATVLRVHR
jgi:ribonuclease J